VQLLEQLPKIKKKWKGVFHVHNPSLFLKEGNQKRKKKNWAGHVSRGRPPSLRPAVFYF
jgi:hypothetical protein